MDGTSHRIGTKINGTLVKGFLYHDALSPIAELDGGNNVVSRFIYGTRANVPEYLMRDGVTYRLVCDHLGSVRLVIDAATGVIAQRLDYDEFGVVLADTNPGFQPFGFAGGLYETETGLVRFGARDYNPGTGQWTNRDPISFSGGQSSLYAYVGNDPVNYFDPLGLGPQAAKTNPNDDPVAKIRDIKPKKKVERPEEPLLARMARQSRSLKIRFWRLVTLSQPTRILLPSWNSLLEAGWGSTRILLSKL